MIFLFYIPSSRSIPFALRFSLAFWLFECKFLFFTCCRYSILCIIYQPTCDLMIHIMYSLIRPEFYRHCLPRVIKSVQCNYANITFRLVKYCFSQVLLTSMIGKQYEWNLYFDRNNNIWYNMYYILFKLRRSTRMYNSIPVCDE